MAASGEYVLVHITAASSSSLQGRSLARTSLSAFAHSQQQLHGSTEANTSFLSFQATEELRAALRMQAACHVPSAHAHAIGLASDSSCGAKREMEQTDC